jgi:primosomal protein N' (replication factor Y)
LQEQSLLFAAKLREKLGDRVLGPVSPPVTRVQSLHIKKIVLKIEISANISPVRKLLEAVQHEMQMNSAYKQLLVHFDVDPA